MDKLLVAAALVLPLLVGLVGASSWLVASLRQERERHRSHRPGHVLRGQGEAVTVAELLEDSRERGEAVRLNWTADDEAHVLWWPGIRPYAQDQIGTTALGSVGEFEDWPTAILPKFGEFGEREAW